ncbi:unnamed protein product [Adineta steineri]|uniref:G-protein coupled receptors family 1 profile domain-containing protein n=1 Tax=Adineta steineri TaxID=433720 RepID=A0A815LTA9_9BILA|nr:unnamed protein product [Adineta steineri]CAF1618698.1 unnamed protein product [Adineta steineri]
MSSNETNLLLWPCLDSLHLNPWNLSCIACRLGGGIILIISIVCFIFNIRFLFTQRRQNTLVISLFLASLLVIVISVPRVLAQLFACRRQCSTIYCRIEGFVSYVSGCVCMLVFTILSIHRYISLCSYHKFFSYKLSTFICWFLSFIFAFPLVFDYFNSYIPEGLGFHCSINWQDQSNISRLYILFSFILMYFFPLLILFVVNFRAHFIVRHIYSKHYLNSSFLQYSSQISTIKIHQRIHYFEIDNHKYYIHQASDRKRFRLDYRFLRAIIFLVSSYILAWTPYSIVAISQLLNIKFIFQRTVLITLAAFIAKSSVILSPFVYLSVMNNRLFKRLLFK